MDYGFQAVYADNTLAVRTKPPPGYWCRKGTGMEVLWGESCLLPAMHSGKATDQKGKAAGVAQAPVWKDGILQAELRQESPFVFCNFFEHWRIYVKRFRHKPKLL